MKDLLTNRRADLGEEQIWEEKADQIRIYSGERYRAVEEVPAGTVCAVTGLSRTYPGEGLGCERAPEPPALEPVLTYQVLLPPGCDPHRALLKLRELQEEDPQLHIVWNEPLREIHIQLMGRSSWRSCRCSRSGSAWRSASARREHRLPGDHRRAGGGGGPLRAPAGLRGGPPAAGARPPGQRLQFSSPLRRETCWTGTGSGSPHPHLAERSHRACALTRGPVTDLRITLVAGRAHVKHTPGATSARPTRAVRQGLMQAESILLEPWYEFRLELPAEHVGRALSDLQRMTGEVSPPETEGRRR